MIPFAVVFCLCLAGLFQESPEKTDTPTPPLTQPESNAENAPPDTSNQEISNTNSSKIRVIVYPSRLRSVKGYLIEESKNSIRLIDRNDKTHEFDSSLIYAVVRLHEVDEPVKAVVHMQDGRVREGLLEEDAFDHVQLKIHGVDHRYAREDVAIVQLLPDFNEEYDRLLRELDESNIQAHLSLCRWLIGKGKLNEAKAELERLLRRENNPTASRLLHKIEARLTVEANKRSQRNSEDEDSEEIDNDSMPDLVSNADVNLVRVYEIKLEDPPSLRIPATTVQKLLDDYQGNPMLPQDADGQLAFARSEPADIVEVMFALRARELYGDVQVLTEPDVLSTFRTRIHDNWLLNRCGSRACHGGPEEVAGGFRLHWSYRPDDRVRTSNLLALNRLEFDNKKMLNWTHPKQSLLYQYALPRSEASTPHPEVKGWEPIFTPSGASLRNAYLNWIEQMLARHHKDWPVDYTPWTPTGPEAVSPTPAQEPSDTGQSP